MIIDVHCHYSLSRQQAFVAERFSFEQPVHDESNGRLPTAYDACLSDRVFARLSWRIARWWLGYPLPGEEMDRRLAEDYAEHLLTPGVIDRHVLLAFDAAHADDGTIPELPGSGARFGSDMYVSNSFVRDLCRRHPQRFLFGASVHPYRANAEELIAEVHAGGACLLKWMPLHHNIDVTDERTIDALRACADVGLPVLVHYNEEFTLTSQCPQFRAVGPLLRTLRKLRRQGDMPTVIVAHVATPVWPWGARRPHNELIAALLGEFADAPLYADISALTSWAKVPYLRRLARRQELHAKLLFGTDFPVPVGLGRLRGELGREYHEIGALRSWPEQVAAICRRLGFSDVVFRRAAELLPNVGYFTAA